MFIKITDITTQVFTSYSNNEAQADAIVICLTESELRQGAVLGQPQLDQALQGLKEKGIFTGASGELEALPTHGLLPYAYVLVAGLGPVTSRETLRAASVYAAREALALRLERLALKLPSSIDSRSAVIALTEGLLLGTYRIASYRKNEPVRAELRQAVLLTEAAADAALLAQAIATAETVAEGTNYARDLTNLPGNKLVPASLAEEAMKLAQHCGFACEVLDEQEIAARGMGGLTAVGAGSVNPPRLITLQYKGDPDSTDVLGIVGKGVTFDTGGISMKDPDGMEEMISDMGGAASILGAMHVVGQLKPKVNLIVVIPSAENMTSGAAYRPGDVVTLLSGHSVEVLNTDAEGRIILAEGLTYAKQLGANRLIDVATLTGAVLISFGDVATAAVTNDDEFLKPFMGAAAQADEKVWQLPNYPEYRAMLKSDVADVRNSTGTSRWAGATTAGLFIGFFAEETPWIHLDTGGTAWLWSEKGTEPKGATGVMVRTLASYLCGSAIY
ncbi:leucyl aminopeptidase [Paenibacillus sp. SYP-B3998]|uniref:Probable cytosol aminopeptidase n=1 Tax=Paenibacillus sp. SYP-B3998 TaxID=2678564 RepID=A0A6G3ZYF3_9BACL|nr:leucyl aminopeptidase [Paenibacillus sp. SYP-B3998]NEW07243.1 leucyl aminopeptidase [Paenibacillus sp. SYP-B3998]